MKQRKDGVVTRSAGSQRITVGRPAYPATTSSMPRSSRRTTPGRRGARRTFAALLGLIVLAVLAVMIVQPTLSGGGDAAGGGVTGSVIFRVNTGDTVTVLAGRLQTAGVLDNGLSALAFQLDGRMAGLGGKLRAGTYTLHRSMSATAAVAALSQRPIPLQQATITVTIRPGLRLEEIAHLLAVAGVVDEAQFLDLARHGRFTNDFLSDRPAGASLEGYLFPDTYNLLPRAGAPAVIQTLLDRFGAQVSLPLRRAAWAQGRTLYQVVTLASIVQREAIYAAERPLIAGVYMNRIAGNEGGYLNADPTVQYAVGPTTYASPEHTWWTRSLTQGDLAVDSPYNTYVYRGLPPGPISSPALSSLQAAARPAHTDYNYFYAPPGGGGHSKFCVTLACHNALINGG